MIQKTLGAANISQKLRERSNRYPLTIRPPQTKKPVLSPQFRTARPRKGGFSYGASMQFDIRSDAREVSRWLDDAQKKQIPFATVYAMTLTARDVRTAEIAVMEKVFDRPTPYTLNALQVKPATKQTMVASVAFKEFGGTPAKRFLNPEVHGGPRSQKSNEKQLSPLMKGFQFAVPGKATDRDAYGNMKGSEYKRILSQLKVSSDPLQNTTNSGRSKRKRKHNAFFIQRNIVFQRTGAGIKPVLVFVKPPRYRKRFPFYETGAQVVASRFKQNFEAAFQRTMANSGYKSARGGKWRY